MKVVLAIHHRLDLWNAPEWLAPRLQREFPQHTFVHLSNLDQLASEIVDADILICWQLRSEQFEAARKLRWIHATTAAVHQLLFPNMVASQVRLTNSTEIHGAVVAEHAMAMIFALAKGLPAISKFQPRHHWGQQDLWHSSMRPREIAGALLLVIGLGAIGKECVRLAKSLGMRVIAIREHPELGAAGADRVLGPSQLTAALAEADYVLVAAPQTPKTKALFNDKVFSAMRNDACFLNVSRGALVYEPALTDALRSGKIRAAALDVFEIEPLPAQSPLWDLENLFITPHTAALTDKLWERHFVRICENLRRYADGQPLLGEVDKHKGY